MGQALLQFFSMTEVWVGGLGLAAFLTVFWVLRGAPIGQAVANEEHDEAPLSAHRDRVIAAVSIGLVLILIGGYLAIARGVAWSLPAFALGFGTVFVLVLINQRYRHGSPTLRRTVGLATTALNGSLLAGVLIIFNVVAFRFGGEALDLTSEGAYTISSQTKAQLNTLTRPVKFTTFFGRSAGASQQYDRVQQLLELYKAANPEKVILDHIDPFRDLGRYDELVKKVPDIGITQGGGVVVEYGETDTDHVVVRNMDLFEIPNAARFDPTAEKLEIAFKGEDALTSALMRLREAKKPKAVFLIGHGEPSLDDMKSNSGLGNWRGRLLSTGFEVSSINLLVSQAIPDDATLVIITGPKTPFKPDEIAILKSYIDRKGPLLILLGDVESTGLEAFLQPFGIEMGKGFIVEPRLNYRNPQVNIAPIQAQTHPILESLNEQFVMLPRPTPLKIAGQSGANPTTGPTAFQLTPLLKSSPQSWSEPELSERRLEKDQKDEAGPFITGIAVTDRVAPGESKPGAARMAVYSCRYLGENGMVAMSPANLDLLMNSVNWLRGRAGEIGIPAHKHSTMTLNADPVLRSRLILVPTVMALLLIVTLGVVTYLARRD